MILTKYTMRKDKQQILVGWTVHKRKFSVIMSLVNSPLIVMPNSQRKRVNIQPSPFCFSLKEVNK